MMLVVTIYLKAASDAYQQVRGWLDTMQEEIPHKTVEVNIAHDPKLEQKLGNSTLTVQIGPYILRWPFTDIELRVSLQAAEDRKKRLENSGDKKYKKRVNRGHTLSGTDRFSMWFSKYYMIVIAFLLLLYAGLPVLAPVLMHYDLRIPAKVIYTIYRPLCHQLGFRSVFLYGDQLYYPRELAHLSGYQTWESISQDQNIDFVEASKDIGNEIMGYKTAFCQRDLAMYGSLLLFAVIFIISGRKIKSIPWYVWVVLGLVPIALDGVTQLPGAIGSLLPSWFPVRESTPLIRFVTGFLFGFTTGWYLFPMLEETMSDTYQMLERKRSIILQLAESDKTINHAVSK